MCSPVGESQANGAVEGTIRRLAGMLRTIKSGCESKLKMKIERDHPLFQWMVPWAATIINRYVRDTRGRTAYQRRTGREAKKNVCEFGEKILYYPLKGAHREKDKAEAKWRYGIWRGIADKSDEVTIGTEEGTVKARAIRRLAEQSKWDRETVDRMRGTPKQPIPGHDSDYIPTSTGRRVTDDQGERE